MIRYQEDEEGMVMIQFVKSHIGHEGNVGRVNLLKDERAEIAGRYIYKYIIYSRRYLT